MKLHIHLDSGFKWLKELFPAVFYIWKYEDEDNRYCPIYNKRQHWGGGSTEGGEWVDTDRDKKNVNRAEKKHDNLFKLARIVMYFRNVLKKIIF